MAAGLLSTFLKPMTTKGEEPQRIARPVKRTSRHESGTWRGGLPEDLLRETAQRLALFCGVGAATWTIAVIMANLLRPTSVPTPFPWPGNVIGAAMVVTLTAAFVYGQAQRDSGPCIHARSRSWAAHPQRLCDRAHQRMGAELP